MIWARLPLGDSSSAGDNVIWTRLPLGNSSSAGDKCDLYDDSAEDTVTDCKAQCDMGPSACPGTLPGHRSIRTQFIKLPLFVCLYL